MSIPQKPHHRAASNKAFCPCAKHHLPGALKLLALAVVLASAVWLSGQTKSPDTSTPKQQEPRVSAPRRPARSRASARSRAEQKRIEEVLQLPISTPEDYGIELFQPAPPPEPVAEKAASVGRAAAESPPPSPIEIIKVIVGFVVLAALAYMGSHPWFQRLEQRLQISHVVTAGIPFIILGVIARDPRVGILSEAVLQQIRPIITFGLGSIGFAVGFRFDVRLLTPVPKNVGAAAAWLTLVPVAVISAVCILVLNTLPGGDSAAGFLRDALIVGIAGGITAKSAPLLLQRTGAEPQAIDRMWTIVHLEQLAGIGGLLLLGAYFRPDRSAVAWQLPGTGWLFVTLGVASVMALVIYFLLGKATTSPQFYVVLLGSVCFAAGMATFLRLSAVVVCFIVGAVLVNFPSTWRNEVGEALVALERPVYFLFLVIAGALWRSAGWQGWLLMLMFVLSRVVAKWVAVTILNNGKEQAFTRSEQRSLIIGPVGALSIAIVVNAQDLYSGSAIPTVVTAVIGGAILSEIMIQVATRYGYLDAPQAAESGMPY